jgi:excisionase family DNA binding protein
MATEGLLCARLVTIARDLGGFAAHSRRMTLLNTKEAAERLGISTVRVRQLIREGKIEAQNLGRDYAISADALSKVVVYRKPGRPPASKSAKKASKKRK